MKTFKALALTVALVLVFATVSAKDLPFPEISRITQKALNSMLGDRNIVILDVRLEEQWQVADLEIMRAVHENPKEYKSWAKKYGKDQTLVFYCA